MTINRFTVFGQRCSGTNALIKLVEANFPSLPFCEQSGFKHWLVPDERELPDDLLVIVIAREVESWLRSLHRNPWHVVHEMRNLSFSQFIRAEWRTVWDEDFWGMDRTNPLFGKPIGEELCPALGGPFKNAVAMRTAKLRNWLGLQERAAAFWLLSMDDLVADPIRIANDLAAVSGHSRRPLFYPVSSYKGAGKVAFEPRSRERLSASDRTFVARYLDRNVEEIFHTGRCSKIEKQRIDVCNLSNPSLD